MIEVGSDGELVQVSVSRPVPGPLGWAELMARAEAVALPEPGVP